ncbi:pimeloyl-ACP methyl ester carboxylesterase [Pseudomonas sp. SLBN-26]|uniref:alpha/beta fold hydrolase n=1 Tax=Pseudomonadaceae TaxID=135621 RepID=UPI0011528FD3|nr:MULTISPECIES: alpha/beta fold hydrolase [Pseudomonas]MCP1618553.1 pimeloyl-ACP methyl ester carboxylesterase [Pseudomonas otitidis]TQL07785.1 pimeloyl-ACP methyl ester carboxylesterase [Pseudomonas sp. SLBN-26]
MHYRTGYHADQLGTPPSVLETGPWRLHYQAWSRNAHDTRPPVLMLGGAFQSFRSFAAEVEELLEHHPVILLDLPGQGGNLQLAPELGLEALADLIADFAEALALPSLMPIGLSYGSALAALFASRHPQRCARLLLAGVTTFGRPGARALLEESLCLLEEERLAEFAQGSLTGLINPLRLERTGISPGFRKAMLRQLQRLTGAERERYRQNSRRLLDFAGFTHYPSCPTLVLAGEFDHFTQPWEHAAFAAACTQADCALIHDGDHLAQFERRDACAQLYRPFFLDQALPAAPIGVTRLARSRLNEVERRQEPRLAPAQRAGRLHHAELGSLAVEVQELGFFGARLQAAFPTGLPVRGWQLAMEGLPVLDLLPLRQAGDALSLVFTHMDAAASTALAEHVRPAQLAAAA